MSNYLLSHVSDRDVVRLRGDRHPRRDHRPVGGLHVLAAQEPEPVGEERLARGDVDARDVDVVQVHRRRAAQVGLAALVEQPGVLAALLHLPVDLPRVALGRDEADRVALAELRPRGDLVDLMAVRAQVGGQRVEVGAARGP